MNTENEKSVTFTCGAFETKRKKKNTFGRDYKVCDLHLRPFLNVMNGINTLITAPDLHVRVGTTVNITKLERYIVC